MNNIIQKLSQYSCLLFSMLILYGCQTSEPVKITKKETPIEIAILMPMTGASGQVGKEYNELIKMGIEDSIKGNINVISYDGSDEEQIQQSMQKIIAKRTKIILGPISSPLTAAISAQAEENDIIIISMSNNPVLAAPNLFVFGHAPTKQLDQLINYYLDRRHENFIALLPSGKHSVVINKILQAMIVRKNGALVRSEFYNENQESINKSLMIVSDSINNLNEIADNINKAVIFISEDTKNLSQLFNNAKNYNLDKKAIIIGDNRVDIDLFINFDITFTGSIKKIDSDIKQRAEELDIENLSHMHLLAYDLGNLTAKYIGEKYEREEFLAKMNSPKIFNGLSGKIHFTNSIAERDYDIIRKENNAYTNITELE